MTTFHETPEELTKETRDYMRALNTLQEEVEAIDWYAQRVDGATDHQLKKILKHNMEEEIEHACMTIEWLRRNMDGWDQELKTYLFTDNEITSIEDDG